MTDNGRATKITIHREDGSVWQAEGDDAEAIDAHLGDLEFMAKDHGICYAGPFLKQIVGPREGKNVVAQG